MTLFTLMCHMARAQAPRRLLRSFAQTFSRGREVCDTGLTILANLRERPDPRVGEGLSQLSPGSTSDISFF